MPSRGSSALPPAVVLAEGPGGLGTVRCLGRRGVPVTAVAFHRDEAVLGSRWAARTHVLRREKPEQREYELLDLLHSLAAERPALLCTSDRTLEIVSRHSRSLAAAGFQFLAPPFEAVQTINDKVTETALIASLGFDLPKTIYPLPASPEELEAVAGPALILKPRSFREALILNRKNLVARNRAELNAIYAGHRAMLPLLLAQEIIPGDDGAGWMISATFDRSSRMLACAIKRKVRMFPAHFGVSSIAVSQWNPDLAELMRRLGERLRHVGHINAEFRLDSRDGRYKYIEVNPRIPGNVEFDEASGVPTVWSTYLTAVGQPVGPRTAPQRDGVVFIDLLEDLHARLRDGESPAAIARHHVQLLFRKRSGQYFAWDDLMPGARWLLRFARKSGRAIGRRLT